jgi:glycine/D-amino acid oxidase-like deaminating enzyme
MTPKLRSESPTELSSATRVNDWELNTSGFTNSPWYSENHKTRFDTLATNKSTDVAIIGGGIAGMTTAYLLAKYGKNFLLIDDGFIVSGESGRTTAHLTFALDDRYYNLEKKHGTTAAKKIADSHIAAIDFIESVINEEGINCDFQRLDGFLFLDASDVTESLDKELEALRNAGISEAKIKIGSPLERKDIGSCIYIPDQAQFHPLKYIAELAELISSKYDSDIFTETHVQAISSQEEKCIVKTSDGFSITADNVVVATNAPIVDKVSKIYDKLQAYRTYVIGINIRKNSISKGLYWDTGNQKSKHKIKPYHYVRTRKKDKDEIYDLLIVGGEDHKTGSLKDNKQAEKIFGKLENWTRNRFPVEGPMIYKWSGQILEPEDGLAFIGQSSPQEKNIFIATGFSGNGFTYGTISGMLISDLILGNKNDWADLYNPSRIINEDSK